MADAHDDECMAEMIDEFGMESYGRWWVLLEIVAKQMDRGSEQALATYPLMKWRRLLQHYRQSSLNLWLIFLESSGKISIDYDKIKPNLLTIEIPKLLKIRDEYTNRK